MALLRGLTRPVRRLQAVAALLLGVLSVPVGAQGVEVGVGWVPALGPPPLALEDARMASLFVGLGAPTPRLAVAVGVLALQGQSASRLYGDVAFGGTRRRVGALLLAATYTRPGDKVRPFVRAAGGVAGQTQQAGARLAAGMGVGLASGRWPAFVELGGLVTSCETEVRRDHKCSYVPISVGWRF